MYEQLTNYNNGQKVPLTGDFLDVINPLSRGIISQVPLFGPEIVESVVNSARVAFTKWSKVSLSKEARYCIGIKKSP